MAKEVLRPGVRSAYVVRRWLRLLTGVSWDDASLDGTLQALIGFNRLERYGDRLLLEYDAGHLQLDTALALLAEAGVVLRDGYCNRLRLGWYRFTDANVRANSRDTASTCCSQSPLRHR